MIIVRKIRNISSQSDVEKLVHVLFTSGLEFIHSNSQTSQYLIIVTEHFSLSDCCLTCSFYSFQK